MSCFFSFCDREPLKTPSHLTNCFQGCHGASHHPNKGTSHTILTQTTFCLSKYLAPYCYLPSCHQQAYLRSPNYMICRDTKDELLFVKFAQYVLQLLGDTSQQPKILNNLPIKFSGYFFFKRHKAPGPE